MELAQQLGVSRHTIIGIESERIKSPNIELLKKIFEILEIKDKIVLPDYIKFLMDNPSKQLKQFQVENNLAHNELAKIIEIDRYNLKKWINEEVQISIKGYEKIKLAGII